jgi:hypothetical protein
MTCKKFLQESFLSYSTHGETRNRLWVTISIRSWQCFSRIVPKKRFTSRFIILLICILWIRIKKRLSRAHLGFKQKTSKRKLDILINSHNSKETFDHRKIPINSIMLCTYDWWDMVVFWGKKRILLVADESYSSQWFMMDSRKQDPLFLIEFLTI